MRRRPNGREVRPRVRFTEELAPKVFARQETWEIAVLLLGAPTGEKRWTCPANANGIDGSFDTSEFQLVVDEELTEWIGIKPPRSRPMWDDVAGFGEITTRWTRMLCKKYSEFLAHWVRSIRQL